MMRAHLDQAARAAAHARSDLALGSDTAIVDVLDAVERTGGIPVTIVELPDNIAGACLRERGMHFIFINATDHPSRQRFTLAHEYGHARLGHLSRLDTHDQLSSKTRDPVEQEANAFAAAFLAPEPALRLWLTANAPTGLDLAVLVRMAAHFGMSPPAMRYRLENAGVVTGRSVIRSLDEQIDRGEHIGTRRRLGIDDRQDSIALAKKGPLPRLPAKMRELGIEGYEAGVLTLQRLAAGLQRQADEVAAELAESGISQAAAEEPSVEIDDPTLAAELDALLEKRATE